MKICYDIKELNRQLADRPGQTVVFTNGVFDILHPGHIELLEFAKQHGDILILGINDDQSVKRLNKGTDRPIFPLAERMELLSAIQYVDYIIPFNQDTPLELIKGIRKIHTLVKGGDYRPENVVGRKEVESEGGKLLLFQFKSNCSTTKLVEKIKQSI